MVLRLLIIAAFAVGLVVSAPQQSDADTAITSSSHRNSKLLPIVKIVRFLNSECSSSHGHHGTCYNEKECHEAGGEPQGTCANGFGVCCVAKASCDSVISFNNTYFTNPGHPSSYSSPGMCMAEIKPPAGTCQILLTFEAFDLIGPVAGDCDNDTFSFVGGNPGVSIPVLCGYNGGQHYYVDIDQTSGPFKLVTTLSAVGYSRSWKVKVTFIQKHDPGRAPPYCLQYHRESSGMISSFNQGGSNAQLINNLFYGICFGCVPGFCDIGLSFSLFDHGVTGASCGGDYVATGPIQYCGDFQSLTATLNTTAPMVIYVATDANNDNLESGFAGTYMRMAC